MEKREPIFDTVAIIGVGLIGGSIGMAAKARGLARRVIGIGRSPERLRRAKELAAVDYVTTDLAAGVADADLVYICTPVLTVVPFLETMSSMLKEGAIVTDVGSTKAEIVRKAEGVLPPDCSFVGGHPMAGTEEDGVESALPYLFLNATYVVTPTQSTDILALQKVVKFAEGMGSQVFLMDPDQHDRSAAVISHIPHILSAAILKLAVEEQSVSPKVFQLAAGSFRDMTRVAASPPEIWRDVCMSSRKTIASALQRFEEILAEVRTEVELGNATAIEKLFRDARETHSTWIKRSQEEQ